MAGFPGFDPFPSSGRLVRGLSISALSGELIMGADHVDFRLGRNYCDGRAKQSENNRAALGR
jgi:hypothetical protein